MFERLDALTKPREVTECWNQEIRHRQPNSLEGLFLISHDVIQLESNQDLMEQPVIELPTGHDYETLSLNYKPSLIKKDPTQILVENTIGEDVYCSYVLSRRQGKRNTYYGLSIESAIGGIVTTDGAITPDQIYLLARKIWIGHLANTGQTSSLRFEYISIPHRDLLTMTLDCFEPEPFDSLYEGPLENPNFN